MRAGLDAQAERLTLAFEDEAATRQYLAKVRAEGGLQVTLPRRLAQYDVVSVTIELGAALHNAFKAYVARIAEAGEARFDTAFILQDWSADAEQALLEALGRGEESPAPGGGDAPDEPPEPSDPPEAEDEEPAPDRQESRGEARGVSPVHEIKDLNMGQKAILAQRAGRPERQVLLRDTAPQVLQGLLVNPRIEAKEILRIAKSTNATGAILQRIAGDSRWGKNQEILAAVVRNPKSPTLVATRLVDKLRVSDLRLMAKMSSGLKEAVRKAALREYLKRTGAA